MKLIVWAFLWTAVLSCQSRELKEFSWLSGDWVRLNNAEGKKTYEYWKQNHEGIMAGLGLTLNNADTVFIENMTIENDSEKWALVVRGVNEEPTYFDIITKSSHGFVAENTANDFPKKIAYNRLGDTLKATISNEEMSIDFVFLKRD